MPLGRLCGTTQTVIEPGGGVLENLLRCMKWSLIMIASVEAMGMKRIKEEIRKGNIPREEFEVISILNADEEDVLNDKFYTFFFDDIGPKSSAMYCKESSAMRICDAIALYETILQLENKTEAIDLIVHCGAGICRSGAVVQFISDKFNVPIEGSSQIQPNEWVENLLWCVSEEV
jgi:hypothetical protein